MEGRRDLGERLLDYAVRIARVAESLPKTLVGRRIADQLLRSGISVGANYEEAQGAESREDFIHKLHRDQGVARVELLAAPANQGGKVTSERLGDLLDESNQLRAMLSKAVATAKGKKKEPPSAVTMKDEKAA